MCDDEATANAKHDDVGPDLESLRLFCNSFLTGDLATWAEEHHVRACVDAYAIPFLKVCLTTLKAITPMSEGCDLHDLSASDALSKM